MAEVTTTVTGPAGEPVEVKVSSDMTPEQRHNAIARAQGQGGEVKRPHVSFSGPVGHPHAMSSEDKSPAHKALDKAYADAVAKLAAEKGLSDTQREAHRSDLARKYNRELTGILAAHMKAIKAPA